jgi:hypothetical protein
LGVAFLVLLQAQTALGAKSSPPSRPLPFKLVTGTCVFFKKRGSRVMGDFLKKNRKNIFLLKKIIPLRIINEIHMISIEKKYTSSFEIINTFVLVNSGFLLERERERERERRRRILVL